MKQRTENELAHLQQMLEDKRSILKITKDKVMLRSVFIRELHNLDKSGYELPASLDEDAKRIVLQTWKQLKERGEDVYSLFSREKLRELIANHQLSPAELKFAGLATGTTQKTEGKQDESIDDGIRISFQTAVFTKSGVESGYPAGVAGFLEDYPFAKQARGLLGITSMSSGELYEMLEAISSRGLDLAKCCVVAEMFSGPYQSCEGISFQRTGGELYSPGWVAYAC